VTTSGAEQLGHLRGIRLITTSCPEYSTILKYCQYI
jgi:hypothetical protein